MSDRQPTPGLHENFAAKTSPEVAAHPAHEEGLEAAAQAALGHDHLLEVMMDLPEFKDMFSRSMKAYLSKSGLALTPAPVPHRRGIYIASKTKHADRWRFLRDKVGDPIISTWIDEAGAGESNDLADLWRRCILEASTAEVLILYREPEDVLKGGWVELGAALASGVTVFAVGIEEFTIAYDKRIRHFPDMKAAIAAARELRSIPAPQPNLEGRVSELEAALRPFAKWIVPDLDPVSCSGWRFGTEPNGEDYKRAYRLLMSKPNRPKRIRVWANDEHVVLAGASGSRTAIASHRADLYGSR
jgi:hypothetical protein